ncbi:VOC family protein [Tsukamurella sp. 8F]|uniref:VOC family protein n=1 Tax=unclassified Tsukamurella TaxID=2633480 RepID=UPI0023B923CD|nr:MULTISPECIES: VOC family protein [unclassified Tsukamurella]MDF0530093.1 VOC family protein [Tsukamurella sp. 8J]MDF0586411.1 VOC family protein [Tsukamurella sp. 8F]
MALRLQQINLDCADVAAQSAFWSAALDLPVDPSDGNAFMRTINAAGESLPRLMFLAVPESKTVKNRMHLDLVSEDRIAEVARLESLGAERVRDYAEYGFVWTVLQDPEGNEFCVADGHGSPAQP